MNHRTTGLVVAGAFFVFWLIVLYAGADHPPPWGFLWAVALDLVAAVLVFRRMPDYIAWSSQGTPGRRLRAVRDGAVTGFLFALFACLIPNTGEPDVQRGPKEYAIWFLVIVVVGIFNGLGLYGIGALARRWLHREPATRPGP